MHGSRSSNTVRKYNASSAESSLSRTPGGVSLFRRNFFFSSRRRHTRFDCDWSSDVCSSDLRQEAKNQLFQAARAQNVAIIAREPLSNGFLSGKFTIDSTFPSGDIRSNFPSNYQVGLVRAAQQLRLLESKTRTLAQASIRFTLDHKDVSTVIPGAKTPQQIEENMKASDLPPLTGEELLRIRILREQEFA